MSERKANARRMAAVIERWRRSGRTLSAFAGAQGVTRGKLEYWRRRLGAASRRGRKSKFREVTFAPVELVPATAPAVEVILPGGVRLAISGSATPDIVAAVMEGLRRGC